MLQVKNVHLITKKEYSQKKPTISLQIAKTHRYDNSLLCCCLANNPYGLQIAYVDLALFWFLCAVQYQSLAEAWQYPINQRWIFPITYLKSIWWDLLSTDTRWLALITLEYFKDDCKGLLTARKSSHQGHCLMMRDHIAWWCWHSSTDIYKHYWYLYLEM